MWYLKTLVVASLLAMLHLANSFAAETVVKEAPLTWKQAATSDGGELYVGLCAVCHGSGGKGNGPAAAALKDTVPDLTTLAANNDGNFPRERVANAIKGQARIISHGTVDMPIWGSAFYSLRPDWKPVRRSAFASQRIYNLTAYLETLQQ